jgi:hypothetical protein
MINEMRLLRSILTSLIGVMLATSAASQQRPIFDPDDAVDPRSINRPLFISRLAVGGANGFVDDFRQLDGNVSFLHLANSVYWKHYQFDYKHSEVFGKDMPVSVCPCNGHPIYFPTPPSADSTPAPPPSGSKDTLQLGWYQQHDVGPANPPIVRRYRLTWSRRSIHEHLVNISTGVSSVVSGREQSFGIDADTYFRIAGHDVWGSLLCARTVTNGPIDHRSQNELAYTSRFPGRTLGPVLFRATLTVGGVTNRGSSGLNVVNPAFEAFWHHSGTDVNLHLVWSPLAMRSGAEGWQTHSQIALFVDRALYVKLFSPRKNDRKPRR